MLECQNSENDSKKKDNDSENYETKENSENPSLSEEENDVSEESDQKERLVKLSLDLNIPLQNDESSGEVVNYGFENDESATNFNDDSNSNKYQNDTSNHHYITALLGRPVGKVLNTCETEIMIPDDTLMNCNKDKSKNKNSHDPKGYPATEKIPLKEVRTTVVPIISNNCEKALEAQKEYLDTSVQNGGKEINNEISHSAAKLNQQNNGTGKAFEEYFMPANTHKKLLRKTLNRNKIEKEKWRIKITQFSNDFRNDESSGEVVNYGFENDESATNFNDDSNSNKYQNDTSNHHYITALLGRPVGKVLNTCETEIMIPDDTLMNCNKDKSKNKNSHDPKGYPATEKIPLKEVRTTVVPIISNNCEKALEAQKEYLDTSVQNGGKEINNEISHSAAKLNQQNNGTGKAFEEYFMPANTHKKLLRKTLNRNKIEKEKWRIKITQFSNDFRNSENDSKKKDNDSENYETKENSENPSLSEEENDVSEESDQKERLVKLSLDLNIPLQNDESSGEVVNYGFENDESATNFNDDSNSNKYQNDTSNHHYITALLGRPVGKVLNTCETEIMIPDDTLMNCNKDKSKNKNSHDPKGYPATEKIPLKEVRTTVVPIISNNCEKALEAQKEYLDTSVQNGGKEINNEISHSAAKLNQQNNGTGKAFEEYFMPANTHKKLLR
ncbi:GATA zinc finger domain-containing protein 15-like [Centruroides sculpturatus]|uniref:GATA zinc finger domain-containing protein 15-like n=1 Tax=Centruroides sculpturatus TaxID=218467 RepID=UPI000C6DFCD4|nr:GATA zinc finger domain-containing protein 15-like [Centruroides sculpturatus]